MNEYPPNPYAIYLDHPVSNDQPVSSRQGLPMKADPSLARIRQRLVPTVLATLLGAGLIGPAATAEPKPLDKEHAAKMAKGLEVFKQHVRPVLEQRCVRCHGGKLTKADFDLTDRDDLLRGGASGPAINVGSARESLLYKLISHAREPSMPQNGSKLPDEIIARIAEWINLGAPYDQPLVDKKMKGPHWSQRLVPDLARQFWSFRPLKRAEPPPVKDASWCRSPLDRFILARLEAARIPPNPPVDKRLLIRRAYLDLIGLPPPPQEIEAFANDPAADAYARLVDRLLESPHYGERYGRYWLDLARFAESHGFEHDTDRPSAYHYRDFVIQALNQDLPYDTFVKWQLAGDEFEPNNKLALMATGFLAAGVHSTQITKKEVEKHRYDEMDDMTATIGTSMLGLTLGCARCHDHKFDPIPQADYYRMVATFTTTVRTEIDLQPVPDSYHKAKAIFDEAHKPFVEALRKFEQEQLPARLAEWEKSLTAAPPKPPEKIAPLLKLPAAERTPAQTAELRQWYRTLDPEWKKLNQKAQEHLKRSPQPPRMLISSEGLTAVRLHTQGDDFLKETHFLRRGDPDNKEGVAPPGFLQVLTTAPDREQHWQVPPPPGWRTSYRRTALANWITDVDQGAGQLLARVIVNRLWQFHMGRGIVATPSDFGTRGERPTHPELLDWLATELIKNGWRLKPIHQLIMTSAVYQQSSHIDATKAKVDTDNLLFWRRPRHRLEAEVIRDSLLSVGGVLDPKLLGPGTLEEASQRRSIYFTVKRSKLMPMMQVFDAPEALGSVGARPTTTIAPQALILMNNPQIRGYALGFAKRVAPDAKTSVDHAVKAGYLTALARLPNADELAESVAFVKQQIESYQAAGKGDGREPAFTDFCQVLMCLNEFVYVD